MNVGTLLNWPKIMYITLYIHVRSSWVPIATPVDPSIITTDLGTHFRVINNLYPELQLLVAIMFCVIRYHFIPVTLGRSNLTRRKYLRSLKEKQGNDKQQVLDSLLRLATGLLT